MLYRKSGNCMNVGREFGLEINLDKVSNDGLLSRECRSRS
jgi:hypothetical protein